MNDNPYASPREQGAKRGMNYLLWAKIQFVVGGIVLLLSFAMLFVGIVNGVPYIFSNVLVCILTGLCCIGIGCNNLRLHELRKEPPHHEQ